jgi:WD40 repeat protein/serine/threonine protein kinase/tetratricopeptide (TPR) repeat protein
MSTETNQDRIDELFHQALNLPRDERRAFLAAAANGDLSLLVEVEKLLAAHERAEQSTHFLGSLPSDERLFAETTPTQHPLVGQRVGSYEVIRWLDHGGFGDVFLGMRTDDYRQKVAIKVLRSDIVGHDRARTRFELERQLQADFQHEHIARLLYGGQLDDGRPYMVMEYVKGKPITEYCDNKRLTVPERLCLFRQVCEAVAYAHRFGAIHRDIKPSNILVTDDGNVKLLDFGIAKMVDPVSQRRMVTVTQEFMPLTWDYASPEQARGVRGEGISTASDVYSLGVVLYELLTGRRPYELHGCSAAERERIICERDPRKPSTIVLESFRIHRDDGTEDNRLADTVAEPRSANPQTLNRLLKGDLEQIVLTALFKQPKDRYPTVDALIDDLDRFQRGQPVHARPIGLLGKTWRWAKRRPAAAALLAIIAVVAVIGPIVAVQQAILRVQRDRLFTEREQAFAERDKKIEELQKQSAQTFIRQAQAKHQADDFAGAIALLVRAHDLAPANDPVRVSTRNLMAGWASQCGQALIHDDYVIQANFSPDGRFVVTASDDHTARVWDARTGKPIGEPMRHSAAVSYADFSPDSRSLVTTCRDKTARLWDANTGKPITKPLAHDENFWSAAVSPDGRTITTATYPSGGSERAIERRDLTVHLWSVQTGKRLHEPLAHQGDPKFSPDGKHMVTILGDVFGGGGTNAQQWDVATGKPFGGQMFNHGGRISELVYSPDGTWIAAIAELESARLWHAKTGAGLTKPLHHAGIRHIAFSPDSKILVTGGRTEVRVWDVNSFEELEVLYHDAVIVSLRITSDGKTLNVVTSNNKVVQRRMSELHNDVEFPAIEDATLSPTGDAFLKISGNAAWLFYAGPTFAREFKCLDVGSPVAISPDCRTLIGASSESLLRYDIETGNILCEPVQFEGNIAAFSADSSLLCTDDGNGNARIWDVSSRKPVSNSFRTEVYQGVFAFSPDNRCIVSCYKDHTARLWNCRTGAPLTAPLRHEAEVSAVAFAPDGGSIFTGSDDGAARRWDAQTGALLGIPLRNSGSVTTAAISPDGQTLATGSSDGAVRLWSAKTGAMLIEPLRQDYTVDIAAFGPEGRTIATAGLYADLQLWDSRTGLALSTPGYDMYYDGIAVSSDGSTIVALVGNNARFWKVPRPLADDSSRIHAWALARTGLECDPNGFLRQLSQAEWLRAIDELERLDRDRQFPRLGAGCLNDQLWSAEQALTTSREKNGPCHRGTLRAAVHLATAYRDAGRLDDAIQLLNETLVASEAQLGPTAPDLIPIFDNLAIIYRRADRLDDATPLYSRALAIIKNDSTWDKANQAARLKLLASILQIDGKLEDASQLFDQRRQTQPGDPWHWYDACISHLGANNRSAYERTCREMLTHFATSKDPAVAARVVFACVPVADAIEDTKTLVRLAKVARSAERGNQRSVAAALYRAGNVTEAFDQFQASAKSGYERRAWDYAFLAMIHFQLKNFQHANLLLRVARTKFKQISDWREKVEVEHLLIEAEKLLASPNVTNAANPKPIIELEPEHAATLNYLAWILATSTVNEARDGQSALQLATRACELTNYKSSNYVDTLAAAYAETGDFDSAVKWSTKALEIIGESGNASRRRMFTRALENYKAKKPTREEKTTPAPQLDDDLQYVPARYNFG